MSYEVKFRTRDQPSVTLDNQRGEKLKELWFDDKKRSTPVEIQGNAYLVGDIKSILHVPDPMPTMVDWDQDLLPQGNVCKGTHSIQHEINNVAKGSGGNWAKLIRDRRWRDQTRLKLREAPGVLWCDYKSNECACKT